MKEHATMQKLQQFKELLRKSQTAGVHAGPSGDSSRTMQTAPGNIRNGDFSGYDYSRSNNVSRDNTQVEIPPESAHKITNERLTDTRQTDRTNFTKVNITDKPMTRQTVRTTFSDAYDDMPNTRETTRTNFSQDLPAEPRTTSSKSVRSIPDSSFYAARKEQKDPTSRWESSYSRPSTAASNRVQTDDHFMNGTHEHMTDDFKSNSAKTRSTHFETVPMNGYEPEPESKPTYMPSEYIYSMDTKNDFDGRKMGLASNTFDSALAQMLEESSKKMNYEQEEYDQYARQKPYQANPYMQTTQAKHWDKSKQSKSKKASERKTAYWSEDDGRIEDNSYGARKSSPPRKLSPERQPAWKTDTQQEAKYKPDNSAFDIWPSAGRNTAWGPEAKVNKKCLI